MKKNRVEDELIKESLQIMRDMLKYTPWIGVMMYGDVSVVDDPSVPTACTDGKNERFSRAFLELQNSKQKKCLRLHEVFHKGYRHMFVWEHLWKESPTLANISCDIVINNELFADPDLEQPVGFDGQPCGVFDHRFDDMNAGEIYRILKKEQESRPKTPTSGNQPCSNPPQNGSVNGKDIPRDDEGGADGGMDIHDWLAAQKLTEEEKKAIEKDIDQALRHGLILAGKNGTGGSRELTEFLKPQVNWKEQMRDFIKTMCLQREFTSWSKVNKRFMDYDDFMPGWVGETVPRIGLYVDESGSVSHEVQMKFLSEGKAIAAEINPDMLDIAFWDTCVHKHQTFDKEGQEQKFEAEVKPMGGGGTAPSCIPPYMIGNKIVPHVAVVLTDGYVGGDWGNQIEHWPCPVLWVICGDKKASPTTGKTIFLDE